MRRMHIQSTPFLSDFQPKALGKASVAFYSAQNGEVGYLKPLRDLWVDFTIDASIQSGFRIRARAGIELKAVKKESLDWDHAKE